MERVKLGLAAAKQGEQEAAAAHRRREKRRDSRKPPPAPKGGSALLPVVPAVRSSHLAEDVERLASAHEAGQHSYRKFLREVVQRCYEAAGLLRNDTTAFESLCNSARWGTRERPKVTSDPLPAVLRLVVGNDKRASEYRKAVDPYLDELTTPKQALEAVAKAGGFRKAIAAHKRAEEDDDDYGEDEGAEGSPCPITAKAGADSVSTGSADTDDSSLTPDSAPILTFGDAAKLPRVEPSGKTYLLLAGWLRADEDGQLRLEIEVVVQS